MAQQTIEATNRDGRETEKRPAAAQTPDPAPRKASPSPPTAAPRFLPGYYLG